jgi:hypothetical protein
MAIWSCRAKPAGETILPTSHCSLNSTKRPRPADLLLRGEIAYDEAHDAIAGLWDALAELERREYIEYAESLTAAVQSRLAALDLATPVTVNITLAPEGARSDDFDDHAPATYPRNAIEQTIDHAIGSTPTPSALPGTPLDRLATQQR